MLLMRMKRVSLTRSCYFNSMTIKLLGFILLTVFQCFFRRIFATTLKHSDLWAVTTWLKEDNSAKSCALSIATSVSEKNEKLTSKKFSAPWAFHKKVNEVCLSDTILHTKREGPQTMRSSRVLSMAIRRNGRKWFVRLHNFNSNSENYINLVDRIKTNLAPTCQSPTCEGRSRVQVETYEKETREERINQKTPTQDEFLLVPKSDHTSVEQIFERSLNRKKRKMGNANSKRKFL